MQEMKCLTAALGRGWERREKEVALKNTDLKFMDQRHRIMKEMYEEKKQRLQEEKLVLEELQGRVFLEKRQLCSKMHEFSDKYGLLAMMNNPHGFSGQHVRHLDTNRGTCNHVGKDKHQLESAVAELKAELSVADSTLERSILHLAAAQDEHLHLLHSPPDREDRIQKLQDMKQQTELLEVQCEAVQQELGWQNLILKQTTNIEKTPLDCEQNADRLLKCLEIPAKMMKASENSASEHKRQTVPAEPRASKPTRKPFVPKTPSKMSLRTRDLETQLSELITSTKPGK